MDRGAIGKLKENWKEIAQAWFATKLPEECACPFCGQDSWEMLDEIIKLALDAECLHKNYFAPQVILCCSNCSHCATFAAVPMGLYECDKRETV